jgi:predicted nucleotide-binding protein
MPTNKELLLSLREGFEQLECFDDSGLNILRDRAQMIIRRIFGPGSSYSERLSSIEFYYSGPVITILGKPETPAERASRERYWLNGQRQSISLIDTMLEDLELSEPEQAQGREEPTGPRSDRVFVVHGHDREMKQAVARTIERIGLEAVILHERPDRGQTIIEKIERFSDVDFAVVLLSPDDTGYSKADGEDAAKPRARQNVIFELGYFAGKLGRENVVALYKGEIERPSDYDGVLYKRYDGDSGTWRSKLVVELKESGYDVSADNLQPPSLT